MRESDANARENNYNTFRMQQTLSLLGLTEQQVRTATVNPFRRGLIVWLSCVPVAIGLSVAVGIWGKNTSVPSGLAEITGACLIGLCAMSAADAALKYWKFNRAKKLLGNTVPPADVQDETI